MPALPSELLSVVIAAVEHRETILTLCYVSHMMKHLAEGELLRTVTIDHQSQRYNMATISSYILAPQKEDRRLLVKSLRVIDNTIDSHLYQDDIKMLDTLIPQLQNLNALFLSFCVTPDSGILSFLKVPLPNVQLKQLGIDIKINTDGHELHDDFDAQAHPDYILDISDFLRSQPRLTYLEYLNDHYIRINDDTLVNPELDTTISLDKPALFINPSYKKEMCHRAITYNIFRTWSSEKHGSRIREKVTQFRTLSIHPSRCIHKFRQTHAGLIKKMRAITIFGARLLLAATSTSPAVLRAFIPKAPNIKCLDTNLDFARHTKIPALVMRSLAKLQHLRIQQGKSITASFVEGLFNLTEGQESLRIIEVQGDDVHGYLRKSFGTSHIADSGGCTDCVEFWLHEQATVRIRRVMNELNNMGLQSLWDSIPISTMDFE
ncbi:hypothetical protein ONZ45_g2448 [Pleurotus djamor]|nr:hypothetical protein ONZ45_g2448 [Pleurotus djamor]